MGVVDRAHITGLLRSKNIQCQIYPILLINDCFLAFDLQKKPAIGVLTWILPESEARVWCVTLNSTQ
jgi:hypothetical protein